MTLRRKFLNGIAWSLLVAAVMNLPMMGRLIRWLIVAALIFTSSHGKLPEPTKSQIEAAKMCKGFGGSELRRMKGSK